MAPATRSRLDPALSHVLSSLRRPGDEAQLTQIIAAFAASDRRFAGSLARTLVKAAPNQRGRRALGIVPRELECLAEQSVRDRDTPLGRVDLLFTNEAVGFELYAELKVHSGYGHEQLSRYRRAIAAARRGHRALIAVTRDLPSYGEGEVSTSGLWLGSVRWRNVFDQLMQIEHAEPALRKLWRQLLLHIRQQGDFGLMDFDPEAVRGWARKREGQSILVEMLEEIFEPTLSMIRKVLAEARGVKRRDSLATEIRHNGKRLVWPWSEGIHLEFAVPASNGERLRVQFKGGMPEPLFTLEARHEDDWVLQGASKKLVQASDKLTKKGFETGRYWGRYWSRPHPPKEWLYKGERTTAALLKLAEKDVRDIVSSGLLDALPRGSATTRPGRTPRRS